MAIRVLVSRAAVADLDAARRWLTQPGAGPSAAGRLRRIRAALRDLARHARLWPEGDHSAVRERQIKGWRILYRVVSDVGDSAGAAVGDVLVVRVFGPGQDRSRF